MPEVHANMPGKLSRFAVAVGDRVKRVEIVATLEAMKTPVDVGSPVEGTVTELRGNPGNIVTPDTALVLIG